MSEASLRPRSMNNNVNHVLSLRKQKVSWPLVSSAGHPSPTSSLSWPRPLDGVWKTYIPFGGLQQTLLHIAEAQQAAHPSIMPPNGRTTGKCQSKSFWLQQREGSIALSFCFSTYPDTAHCWGHMPAPQDLRWSITRKAKRKWWLDMSTIS